MSGDHCEIKGKDNVKSSRMVKVVGAVGVEGCHPGSEQLCTLKLKATLITFMRKVRTGPINITFFFLKLAFSECM